MRSACLYFSNPGALISTNVNIILFRLKTAYKYIYDLMNHGFFKAVSTSEFLSFNPVRRPSVCPSSFDFFFDPWMSGKGHRWGSEMILDIRTFKFS